MYSSISISSPYSHLKVFTRFSQSPFSFSFTEQYIFPELSPFNKFLFESKWNFEYSVKKNIIFYIQNSHFFRAVTLPPHDSLKVFVSRLLSQHVLKMVKHTFTSRQRYLRQPWQDRRNKI